MKKVKLIYIVGASHSGTTLLGMLLGAHNKIATFGQLELTSMGDINKYICSCRQPILKCKFWSKITNKMVNMGHRFNLDHAGTSIRGCDNKLVKFMLRPLVRNRYLEICRDMVLVCIPEWRNWIKGFYNKNFSIIECLLDEIKKDYIVDTSKIGLRLKYLLKDPRFDIWIIHVVRDGRAVALTYMDPLNYADAKDEKYKDGGQGGRRETEKLSMQDASREWLRSNEEAECLLSSVKPDRTIQVKYESFCEEPLSTINSILQLIDIDQLTEIPEFKSLEHHVIGNGMRFDDSNEILLDDRWKNILTEELLSDFNDVAGKNNREYGYAE